MLKPKTFNKIIVQICSIVSDKGDDQPVSLNFFYFFLFWETKLKYS